jgi:hypothetical protein
MDDEALGCGGILIGLAAGSLLWAVILGLLWWLFR